MAYKKTKKMSKGDAAKKMMGGGMMKKTKKMSKGGKMMKKMK